MMRPDPARSNLGMRYELRYEFSFVFTVMKTGFEYSTNVKVTSPAVRYLK